jgi:hypothetical protein
MKTKTFDCVEMKHKAGHRIYEQLKGKSVDEQIEEKRQEKVRVDSDRSPQSAPT